MTAVTRIGPQPGPQERVCRVYALLCPETGTPRYVGKTTQRLIDRIRSHVNAARKQKTPKDIWIKAIKSPPAAIVLQECGVAESASVERRWVKRLSRFPLLNAAPAGSGNPGVGRVAWTDEIDKRLGTVNDAELAALLGCDRKTVAYRRACFGIPPCRDRTKNQPPPPTGGWNKKPIPPEVDQYLGRLPDYKVAEQFDIPKRAVQRRRKKLGISSYAQLTGNDGRIKQGEPHRRWTA